MLNTINQTVGNVTYQVFSDQSCISSLYLSVDFKDSQRIHNSQTKPKVDGVYVYFSLIVYLGFPVQRFTEKYRNTEIITGRPLLPLIFELVLYILQRSTFLRLGVVTVRFKCETPNYINYINKNAP